MSSPLDAQTRRFRRPPTGLTVERAERGSPNSNTRVRTTVEVRTGMQIAARRHWHGVRANIEQGLCWPPDSPVPSGSQHGWPSREQDVPFRFKAVQYLPHGTPGRYPAKPHDPEKRISRPGAASDSGRIGHFAGARGSRGGYPLAALGSEDWCNPSHGGVFSGGRPSVHGVAPSPTAPASSRVSRE